MLADQSGITVLAGASNRYFLGSHMKLYIHVVYIYFVPCQCEVGPRSSVRFKCCVKVRSECYDPVYEASNAATSSYVPFVHLANVFHQSTTTS